MARKLQNLTNVEAPDSDFIYGRVRDREGSVPGTPVNEAMVGDMLQFFARLLQESGVTPNDLPDSEYNGFQLYEALMNTTLKKKVLEIGSWDMDATSAVAINHGISDWTQIRTVKVLIYVDGLVGAEMLLNEGDGYLTITSTQISLTRVLGGRFDSATFDDTTINRGFIIIEYDPNA